MHGYIRFYIFYSHVKGRFETSSKRSLRASVKFINETTTTTKIIDFGKPKTTRAHQQMRYPNVTWRKLIILYGYLFTSELRHTCTPNIFEVTRTYLMDVDLQKAPLVSCYYPLYLFLE